MHKLILSLLAICFMTLGSACSRSAETGQFRAVDSSCWRYGDTLSYNIATADSVWHGDIAIVVRHAASYPFSNLWLEIGYPPNDSIKPDTLDIVLADDFGNWLGRGLGLSFQRTDTVVRGVTVTSPADFYVRHIMRSDCLSDIEQIGLIFIPSENLY